MLAETRREGPHRRPVGVRHVAGGDGSDLAPPEHRGRRQGGGEPARLELRVGHHLAEARYGRGRHPRRLEALEPDPGGRPPEPRAQLGAHRLPVRDEVRIGREPRIVPQLRAAEGLEQAVHLRAGEGGDLHVAVRGREHVRGRELRQGLVAEQLRLLAGREVVVVQRIEEGDGRIEHGHVEELAGPGLLAAAKGGRDGERGHHPGGDVDDRGYGPGGAGLLMTVRGHHPRGGLDGAVERGHGPARPLLAVAGDRAVDDRRPPPADGLVAEPEPPDHPGLEVLDQHVRPPDDPLDGRPPLGALEVDGEGAFVVVDPDEGGGHLPLPEAGEVQHPARDVAARRRLDLDDLRPEQRELVGRDRAGHDLGEVDDPDPLERLAHRSRTPEPEPEVRTSRPRGGPRPPRPRRCGAGGTRASTCRRSRRGRGGGRRPDRSARAPRSGSRRR